MSWVFFGSMTIYWPNQMNTTSKNNLILNLNMVPNQDWVFFFWNKESEYVLAGEDPTKGHG